MPSRYWIILLIIICFGAGLASVSAQRCIDPATGGAIPCPKDKDSKSSDQPDPTSTPNGDRDGDGLSNESDRCPDAGGHERNQGCPEDDTVPAEPVAEPTSEPIITLPILPIEGRCLLATQGPERVNVRDIPSLSGQIVAQLDPQVIYPVHLHLLGSPPENDDWFLVSDGWVSSTVVRLGGDCQDIPTHYIGLPGVIFNRQIRRVSPNVIDLAATSLMPFYLQFCSDGGVQLITETPISDCDGNDVPFDGAQSLIECDGKVHSVTGDVDDCPEQASDFGILLNEAGEAVAITMKFDPNIVGFNPQPEPPASDGNCATNMGLPSNGLVEKGFNPQPEPPAMPICLLFMNDGTEDEDGGIALLSGMGGEQGIIVVDGYGGPDTDEQGIIIINGYGGPDADEQGINGNSCSPSSDEQGIIIINGYGGPDADEQGINGNSCNTSNFPAETKWTGIGNSLIIGESDGQVFMCPGSDVGFNPQPEPPAIGDSSTQPGSGLEEVGFNPQPEPPAIGDSSTQPSSGLEEVGFNPQPEPPAHCINISVGF